MSNDQTIKNVSFQARRAANLLDISLTSSKSFIARAIYLCHDFQDLTDKIKAKKLKRSVLGFSRLNPRSDLDELTFLEDNLQQLSERVKLHLRKPVSSFQVLKFIWSIFGIDKRPSSECMDRHVKVNKWYTYLFASDDDSAVSMFECVINGVLHHVYFTKVINADSFPSLNREDAELLREQVFSEFSCPPILWEDNRKWRSVLSEIIKDLRKGNLSEYFDLHAIQEISTPVQKEYEKGLNEVFSELDLGLMGTNLKPFEHLDCQYLVVGFPVSQASAKGELETLPQINLTEEDISNSKCTISVLEKMLVVDLLPFDDSNQYTGEKADLNAEYARAVFSFGGGRKLPIVIGDSRYIAFVRNATSAEINRNMDSSVYLIE